MTETMYFTPPTLAKQIGVSVPKILGWIEVGELRAVNLASRTSGRPRWRISEADWQAFLATRSSRPAAVAKPRRAQIRQVKSFV